jgi:hypothetical protein
MRRGVLVLWKMGHGSSYIWEVLRNQPHPLVEAAGCELAGSPVVALHSQLLRHGRRRPHRERAGPSSSPLCSGPCISPLSHPSEAGRDRIRLEARQSSQLFSSYWVLSLDVNSLALMIRTRSSLSVWATISNRLCIDTPTVMNRSSYAEWSGSGTEMLMSSWKTEAASRKDTPCLWRFLAALLGSHSNSMPTAPQCLSF